LSTKKSKLPKGTTFLSINIKDNCSTASDSLWAILKELGLEGKAHCGATIRVGRETHQSCRFWGLYKT